MHEKRALIVDDCPDTLAFLRHMLGACGLITVCAPNGQEGLAEAKKAIISGTPFDLIFLDVMLPDIRGTAVAKELRELGHSKPIINLSSSSSPFLEAADAGADYFFNKKVIKKGLIEALLTTL